LQNEDKSNHQLLQTIKIGHDAKKQLNVPMPKPRYI
jgi:hypothetical protein